MNYYGLKKQDFIDLLKTCNMATKKWTRARLKEFHERRLKILNDYKGGKK